MLEPVNEILRSSGALVIRDTHIGPAGHDVDHTVRQPDLNGDVTIGQLDQRGHFRGLQNRGTTRRERGRQFPRAGHQWKVPRHDHAHRAHGLVAHPPDMRAARMGDRGILRRIEAIGQRGVVFEGGDGVAHIDLGFQPWFAADGHLHLDQAVMARAQTLGDGAEIARPLCRRRGLPGGKGGGGRPGRRIHVGRPAGGYLGHDRAGGRVHDGERRSPRAIAPFAVDEHAARPLKKAVG